MFDLTFCRILTTIADLKIGLQIRLYQLRRKKGVQRLNWMECTSMVIASPLKMELLIVVFTFKIGTDFSIPDKIFIGEILL